MDNDKKKLRLSFDGTGNVKVFLTNTLGASYS